LTAWAGEHGAAWLGEARQGITIYRSLKIMSVESEFARHLAELAAQGRKPKPEAKL